jgi:hypothetical protein
MIARFLPLLFLLCACSTTEQLGLEFPEDQAPLNRHFSFVVDLGDRILVDVGADMPGHNHGILTQPEWHQLPDGRWQVDGMLLHMPGIWELYFDYQMVDGSTRRLVHEINLEHGS